MKKKYRIIYTENKGYYIQFRFLFFLWLYLGDAVSDNYVMPFKFDTLEEAEEFLSDYREGKTIIVKN